MHKLQPANLLFIYLLGKLGPMISTVAKLRKMATTGWLLSTELAVIWLKFFFQDKEESLSEEDISMGAGKVYVTSKVPFPSVFKIHPEWLGHKWTGLDASVPT